MSSPLKDLLRRALTVGAQGVKLVPGRRTIVVLPQGETEVKGEAQTSERIQALLEPLLTAEARRALGFGGAEWDFELEGKGPVGARVEMKGDAWHASLTLDRCTGAPTGDGASATPIAPAARSPAAAPVVPVPREAQRAPEPALERPGETGREPVSEIDRLLGKMLELRASDLHLSSAALPMLRVDGEMQAIADYPQHSAEAVERMLAPIVPARLKDDLERSHDIDFAYELPGRARFRANLFADMRGLGAVFRVIPTKIVSAEELGLPKEILALCNLPKGLVLVTGPTGSGKSTTLAALIDHINRTRRQHIITIEDPIEFVHPSKQCLINQRQVGEHTDSFKRALRAALREDPDVVLLGEMRDLETIAIALETAETGHLVFGTLHTSSAASTVDRIIDQYPAEQQNQIRVMLSSSLKGVICQTLCKKIGGGRVAALEVMLGIPAISNLIRESKIFQIPTVMQTNKKVGMCLMNDSLFKHVTDKLVAPEEALAKAADKPGLLMQFQQAGIRVEGG